MSDLATFQGWPKIPRLEKLHVVVTEKIDGTNAAVGVLPDGTVYAQSRTRLITPQDDNFGFARWAERNAATLRDCLGEGLHFGEWWGVGIQRGYDLQERRFSLFNTRRWHWLDADLSELVEPIGEASTRLREIGVRVVPTLGVRNTVGGQYFDELAETLSDHGSWAAPGYMNPEGFVAYISGADAMFKRILGPAAHVPKSAVEDHRHEMAYA